VTTDQTTTALAGPGFLEPGGPTSVPELTGHRIGKAAPITGAWLDCGCADGGYSRALVDAGADRVVGVDVLADRIAAAQAGDSRSGRVTFVTQTDDSLPLEDGSVDGVLLNEVLEHVADERRTLAEIERVLRPGGRLILFSPNRLFPAEGHGLRFGPDSAIGMPVPLVPWLPSRLTARFMTARNYWPVQLRRLVEGAGLKIEAFGTVFPQFATYSMLPDGVARRYRKAVPALERTPGVRWFGVSVYLNARKP